MKARFFAGLALLLMTVLTACQTLPDSFRKIEIGADKGQVLHALGNPHRTYRKADTDRWVYLFKVGGGVQERELWFQQGRVVFKDGLAPQKESEGDGNFVPVE